MSYSQHKNNDYSNDRLPDQSAAKLTESISSISWANNIGAIFASTLWDGSIRIYEVAHDNYGNSLNLQQKMITQNNFAVTKCCWSSDNSILYFGCADGTLKALDINTSAIVDIGKHESGISSLHYVHNQNVFISTSYDKNIQFWQPNCPQPVFSLNVIEKVYTSDFSYPILVTGMSNQKIGIFDINNLATKTIIDSSDLGKHSQLQSISINHKATAFGVSTFDGRANISDITKNQNGEYHHKAVITFKSNKQQQKGNTVFYPINATAFNPAYEKWFMTAGSDGVMHFWDINSRNNIKSLNYTGNPICAAKVSPKGDMIAYGLGNDWHLGSQGIGKWEPKVGVHVLTAQETKK